MKSSFPDQAHLRSMVEHYLTEKLPNVPIEDQLLMLSGAGLNWMGDFLTDEHISWEKKELHIDDLYLTGVGGPDWLKIVLVDCARSPQKLREFIHASPENEAIFASAKFSTHPILVHIDDGKLKVFDGMHRTVAAIRDGVTTITAFVATQDGGAKPHCEPHVVYDFIRSYQRGINTDREGLIIALRWLKKSYANVEELLKTRFGPDWIRNEEIRAIISEVLVG